LPHLAHATVLQPSASAGPLVRGFPRGPCQERTAEVCGPQRRKGSRHGTCIRSCPARGFGHVGSCGAGLGMRELRPVRESEPLDDATGGVDHGRPWHVCSSPLLPRARISARRTWPAAVHALSLPCRRSGDCRPLSHRHGRRPLRAPPARSVRRSRVEPSPDGSQVHRRSGNSVVSPALSPKALRGRSPRSSHG
jgi:hypothetical protein